MDYDRLTTAYRIAQRDRIETLREQIAAKDSCISRGRVVPDHSDQIFGEARRLKVAVMFLDICGFSSRPAESEKEQDMLVRVLHLYFTEMVKVAEEYGGTVEKNTGDGLMAYFEDSGGDPPASAVKRAVSCALTQFFVTESVLNPIIRNSDLDPLAFRVGIDYGNVSIAQLGAARRFGSIVAVGTTANIACKILAKADKNELLLGEDAHNALPAEWKERWSTLKVENSGWVYNTGQNYRLFSYNGRWKTEQT